MNGADFKPSAEAQADQCAVVLAALREGPKTTLELRALAVASPASRIYDLRGQGHEISTTRAGRFALYCLRRVTELGCLSAVWVLVSLLDAGWAAGVLS